MSAWHAEQLVGFLYGFRITPSSQLWTNVFLHPDSDQGSFGWRGPTVFISELLTHPEHRRMGVARLMYDAFMPARSEPRGVLLAHPLATAAQLTYRSWGWRRVGRGQPFPGTPDYDTLMTHAGEPYVG